MEPTIPNWDHDHCEFCWGKFSLADGDEHEGYTTEDNYLWICPACFCDFEAMFDWDVREEPGHDKDGSVHDPT